ncbi:xanthine dehydrogenase family protein molybdopterin-binding subunit [Flavobacteriaceae bacterium TK19130]|nr:xanthine dehydrogenase family protein molybdopterin-binding subunit [Thermobacterium salinum]
MVKPFNILSDRKGRVEGRAKVTGKALYSAEYELPKLAHGVLIGSTITNGKVIGIDTSIAKEIPGVIDVLSYWNKPSIAALENAEKRKDFPVHHTFFHTTEIDFNDQPIALVVAETLEDASFAASLVKAQYEENKDMDIDFDNVRKRVDLNDMKDDRGSSSNWQNAPHIVDQEYEIAMEVHNPMEMHATIAQWDSANSLHVYDKSQGVNAVQNNLGALFNLDPKNIRVTSEFVGGGFGSGLNMWFNTVAASLAAKQLNRPVKVVLTRPQMFTMVGYRPESWQRVKIGAATDGKLLGVIHQSKHTKSQKHHFSEGITAIAHKVYGFENVQRNAATVPLHLSSPTWMRGPGDSTGTFGVESAIDELCYKMDVDPVDIRMKNIAPYEMQTGNPWSSHFLDECLQRGAETIGWQNRPTKPLQLKEGNWYTGYGMAVGLWNAMRRHAGASIEMDKKGNLVIRTAMTDIGTGTGEAIVNMAHEFLGIPREKINIELGDSIHPKAVTQGGSWGLSSLSGAIAAASTALKEKLATYASTNDQQWKAASIVLGENDISMQGNPNQKVTYASLFTKNNLDTIMVEEYSSAGDEREKYGFCSSAAHFYKVKVHALTGQVRMDRMVIVVDAGTIVNPQAAANQIIGAGVGGVGMALTEKQEVDMNSGRLLGNDFAGYHVAVNADVPLIEVSFIDKPDPNINPMGAKGLGEVGLIGSAPAITNAIYNAIGVRFRKLPVTPDKVTSSLSPSA